MNTMPVNGEETLLTIDSQAKREQVLNSSSANEQGSELLPSQNRRRGQKRRFGAAGIINVLLTNAVLQSLLASNLVSVAASTLISQIINSCLGYAIYGKMVFKAKGLRHHRPLLRYMLLMAGMWLMNAAGIEASEALGVNRNLAAAALIPVLAVVSYWSQKYWVFK